MRTTEQQSKRFAFYICGLSLNEKRGIHTYTMPAYWASYLINGDASGMTDEEIRQCDEHTRDLGSCLDVSREMTFGKFQGIGHELAEYKFRVEKLKA
jgi:hypothetical protein